MSFSNLNLPLKKDQMQSKWGHLKLGQSILIGIDSILRDSAVPEIFYFKQGASQIIIFFVNRNISMQ